MNDDIEKYLSRFKNVEPSCELRQRVLAAANRHWREPKKTRFAFSFEPFLSAAAIILVAIVIWNSWYTFNPKPTVNRIPISLNGNNETMTLIVRASEIRDGIHISCEICEIIQKRSKTTCEINME